MKLTAAVAIGFCCFFFFSFFSLLNSLDYLHVHLLLLLCSCIVVFSLLHGFARSSFLLFMLYSTCIHQRCQGSCLWISDSLHGLARSSFLLFMPYSTFIHQCCKGSCLWSSEPLLCLIRNCSAYDFYRCSSLYYYYYWIMFTFAIIYLFFSPILSAAASGSPPPRREIHSKSAVCSSPMVHPFGLCSTSAYTRQPCIYNPVPLSSISREHSSCFSGS